MLKGFLDFQVRFRISRPSQARRENALIARGLVISHVTSSVRMMTRHNHVILPLRGRRDGVMVSALDSGSRDLGSKPGKVIV